MKIDLPLDRTARAIIQPVSKALFQSIYAIEIMLAIAQTDRFYQAQLAEIAGAQPNYAQQMMRRLESAGVIEPMASEPGQVRHYYRRLPSPLWGFCADLTLDLLSRSDAQVTHLPTRHPDSA
jgi:hypothetical protein